MKSVRHTDRDRRVGMECIAARRHTEVRN